MSTETGPIGRDTERYDARLKVCGAARYPSDQPLSNAAHAYLLTSRVARGRVRGMDLSMARAVPGVLDILWHGNAATLAKPNAPMGGGEPLTTLQDERIWFAGQIIGLVVADSYEAAREAALLVEVDYETEPPSAGFDAAGAVDEIHSDGEPATGDAGAAFESAELRIEQCYETPPQHHNPMELFTTSCEWHGDRLSVHEPSQFVQGLRAQLAMQLDLPPERVRVLSHYVGGAFGCKAQPTARSAWVAVAARRLGRPVKLVATRAQGYTIATFRAETRHRIRLAADRQGRLQALSHESWEIGTRRTGYINAGSSSTSRLYACPHITTRVHRVRADRSQPGFMRAPLEVPYMFALESAIDELAHQLGLDPIELRRRNDTARDPISGRPFSSRQLMRCFDEAAQVFGWHGRDAAPAAMRDGEWRVGYGCASAFYPSNQTPSSARVSLSPDGWARVQTGAHDLGTGTYTVIAQVAAERLGIEVSRVQVELGDSDLPIAGIAGGSTHAASVCHAVALACDQLAAQLAEAAVAAEGPLQGMDASALHLQAGCLAGGGRRQRLTEIAAATGRGRVEAYAENLPQAVPPGAMRRFAQGLPVLADGTSGLPDRIQYAFGAELVEVRVHAHSGEIRVPRIVGAFAAGRILNPRTAHSQLMGGMIWGLSSALHEASEVDPRSARYLNDDLAEYLIPVHADIGAVDVRFVAEDDKQVNPLGIKGIGELGIVGTAAAVANAVFHATGRRIRRLPIRAEDLLG